MDYEAKAREVAAEFTNPFDLDILEEMRLAERIAAAIREAVEGEREALVAEKRAWRAALDSAAGRHAKLAEMLRDFSEDLSHSLAPGSKTPD